MKQFFETMFFDPKWYHYPVILLFLPLSILYGMLMTIRRVTSKRMEFGIPIVSIGNLIVGGSGKTPFTIALAEKLEGVAVVSRGYGRKSSGLVEVSRNGVLLSDVEEAGDEPMLMAQSLPDASVIVSEERHKAIELAKEQGAKVILLDDGFNRVEIEKFEILLEPETIKNYLPFPAGAFREFFRNRCYADVIVKEGESFERQVEVHNPTQRMVLVTAISNPSRLDPYLPKGVIHKVCLEDHAYFDQAMLGSVLKEYQADSILCTSKDKVKMEGFDLPLSEMILSLKVDDGIINQVQKFIAK